MLLDKGNVICSMDIGIDDQWDIEINNRIEERGDLKIIM